MSSGFRVVCAPDKFKGTLSAPQAAAALAAGVRRALSTAVAIEHPLADGGEGTADALHAALGGTWQELDASDPLGRSVRVRALLLPAGRLGTKPSAVLDLAAASGLSLLEPSECDPLRTSSLGTGQALAQLLAAGRDVLLAVGGSATVDGGSGVLVGLGARLLGDSALEPSGGVLHTLRGVDLSAIPGAWRGRVRVACDVDSPLLGPLGAARVFAPQKGASPAGVAQLEAGLEHWARVLQAAAGVEGRAQAAGSGAAGGVAFALAAALGAELLVGAELVLEVSGFSSVLAGADLVLTGEGRVDSQTAHGKAPWAVARAARSAGVPVVAVAGALGPRARELVGPDGFAEVLAASPSAGCPDPSLAAELVSAAAERVVRRFLPGS